MNFYDLFIISSVGLIASSVGTIVGGAAILVIPALVLIGLPASTAIATARIGAMGMMLSGGYYFHKEKKINYPLAIWVTTIACIGALAGAVALPMIHDDSLKHLLVVVILVSIAFTAFDKRRGVVQHSSQSRALRAWGYFIFGIVGFWAGLLGAGYGIFAQYLLVLCFGTTFLESAGISKILGLGVSVTAAIVFAQYGTINWQYGVVLLIAMGIGSGLGAVIALRLGEGLIRQVYLSASLMLTLALLLTK